MNLFRLQNNVPPVYVDESRDFQLFCRLYDSVNAGFKYDVDQIPNILNAYTCRENLLPLLATKYGFFTNKIVSDDSIRYILDAFPSIVRHKGSLAGVQMAINAFLKIHDIRTGILVYAANKSEMIYNVLVDDHTIVIAVDQTIKDIKLLEELFKYVLPTGFGFQFFFFRNISDALAIGSVNAVKLLFVSDNINSMVRQATVSNTPNGYVDSNIGAVDTVNIASTDSRIITEDNNG